MTITEVHHCASLVYNAAFNITLSLSHHEKFITYVVDNQHRYILVGIQRSQLDTQHQRDGPGFISSTVIARCQCIVTSPSISCRNSTFSTSLNMHRQQRRTTHSPPHRLSSISPLFLATSQLIRCLNFGSRTAYRHRIHLRLCTTSSSSSTEPVS